MFNMQVSNFTPIYPREINIYVYTETYTSMFIATSFIIASNWKKMSIRWTGESKTLILSNNRIKKSKRKGRITETITTPRKNIMQSKRSQTQK